MTDLLVRLFVKDNKNITDKNVRTSYGILTSVVGVISNVILFVVKLVIGFIINSISVMADAFNNLSDAASSIISFIGVKLANRPADKEHPFGHGRAEYIAALAVSFLILQVGFSLFKNSVAKIFNPEDVIFNPILIGILVVSVFVKLWLMVFNRKLGKRINSSVMMATAADSFGDVLITSTTIISAILAGAFGWQIDGYVGVLASVFVIIAGINIARDTLVPLLGEPVDRELYHKVTDFVEAYDGIVGSHDLIIHSYGPSHLMGTIDAEVPNDIGMEKAHDIIDQIEKDVLKELDIFLVIHMDPIEVNDHEILEKIDMVEGILEDLDPNVSCHDFKVINEGDNINLIFDLLVPLSYTIEDEEKLEKDIEERVKKIDSKYQTFITVKNSYVEEE